MSALAALFHKDASFVNRFGHLVHGVDQIVGLHKPIHETVYSDSTLENETIDTTTIAEGVVVAHFWSRLTTGSAHPAGVTKVDTLILAVLTRENNGWLVKALENVTLTDPRTGELKLRSTDD
nr:SgcJ/EcaC family oxidoreductase [Croceibacterium sp. D39]